MARLSTKERFECARKNLVATENGQESTMYGHLRDLCIDVLGYSRSSVDIDRSGARGRPDLTIFAPGGADNEKVAWIVLEAKDERELCRDPNQRLRAVRREVEVHHRGHRVVRDGRSDRLGRAPRRPRY